MLTFTETARQMVLSFMAEGYEQQPALRVAVHGSPLAPQYELALALEPDNPKALFNLGLALRELGDDEAADRRFAAAAERGGALDSRVQGRALGLPGARRASSHGE